MITDPIITELLVFAEQDENIRAVLLEGSRANPNGLVDQWSDYDVAFVTRSNAPYLTVNWCAKFTAQFGEVAVMQTPDNPELFRDAHDPLEHYAYLVQFVDGLRLDITFETLTFIRTVTLDSATVVLLDKDCLFPHVTASDSDFRVKRPTAAEFRACCNQFWWTAPYVTKAVAREQLLHAVEMLNTCVRPEYLRMLSWLAGANEDFTVSLGKHSTNIGKFVAQEYYLALLASYPHMDLREIRASLNALTVAFQKLAQTVAAMLGYKYNSSEGERTMKLLVDLDSLSALLAGR